MTDNMADTENWGGDYPAKNTSSKPTVDSMAKLEEELSDMYLEAALDGHMERDDNEKQDLFINKALTLFQQYAEGLVPEKREMFSDKPDMPSFTVGFNQAIDQMKSNIRGIQAGGRK